MTFVSGSIWARLWNETRGRASRLLVVFVVLSSPALASERTSIELVLAVDVSLSVNDAEYALQMNGIANALRDPEVVSLIASHPHGVALSLTQWSGTYTSNQPLPWTLLNDEASVVQMADRIAAMPRNAFGNFTAIGHAVNFAIHEIETNAFDGDEKKIDVSGDGQNNAGPAPSEFWDAARAADITINGLAILSDQPLLGSYYAENVITGSAAFVVTAQDFDAFGDAFKRKLKRELGPKLARLSP